MPGAIQSPPVVSLEPGDYRVLSLRPPWAWAIIFAGKDVENRKWSTPYRGRILIHASSKKATGEYLEWARDEIAKASDIPYDDVPVEFPRSQIIGSVELVDCVSNARSKWADKRSDVHWKLRAPCRLDAPITVHGKLNLWRWSKP